MDFEKRKRLERRRTALELERSSWLTHWRDLNEYVSPRSARFLLTDRNRGDKRHQRIINNTATLALRSLRSGMMSGVSSPSRPWFLLATPDPDLNEFAPVKIWLHDVTQRMRTVFGRSNLYNALPLAYHDLGLYGTHAVALLEDQADTIRLYPFPIGSYMLANSDRNVVDTAIREFQLTARQIEQWFGLDGASDQVKVALQNGNVDASFDIVHAVEPNQDYAPGKLESRFKRFASVYYEKGAQHGKCLSERGFDGFPILAPRWDVTGEDVYGSSPGMDALGDVKQLQQEERRKAQAIDKLVSPPMNAPSSMRNRRASVLPGDINYVDVQQGQQGFTPAYQIEPKLGELGVDIQAIERRIQRAFFEDLFLLIANDTRSNITAREIAERHEEKLLMLGPVLERVNDELFAPLIDRTFDIMWARGQIPPPPEELQDVDLKVEYTSIVAQAQKLVGAASVERFASFVGNIAGVRPDALDRLDVDEMIDTYADITGVPPSLVVPVAEAQQVRDARAQQQQIAQAAQYGMAGAQGAELLSKTDTGSDNALTRIMAAMTGAPVAASQ